MLNISGITTIDAQQAISPIRAMHSLRDTHFEAAELAVAMLGPNWTAERHETYDGHLIVQFTPEDEDECAFVLHGGAEGLQLGLLSAECDYAQLGSFESVQAAAQFAAQLVAGETPLPASVAPAA